LAYLSPKVINEYQERIQQQLVFISKVYEIFDIDEEKSYSECIKMLEDMVRNLREIL